MKVVVFAILAISAVFGDLSLCPLGLQHHNLAQVGSHCFQFHLDEMREYDAAKLTCQHNGGTLAMPKTSEIQNFLRAYLRLNQLYNEPVWIGLNDQDTEHEFHWDDGSILHQFFTYSNWGNNQGHNHLFFGGAYEDCVALDPSDSYKWHDYHCTDAILTGSHSFPFICQYDAISVTLPPFTTDSAQTTDSFGTTDSGTDQPQTTDSGSNPPQTTNSGPISAQTTDGFGTTDQPQTTDSGNNPPQTTDSGSANVQTTDGFGTTDAGPDQPLTTDSSNNQPQTTDSGTNFGLSTDGSPPETTAETPAESTDASVDSGTSVSP